MVIKEIVNNFWYLLITMVVANITKLSTGDLGRTPFNFGMYYEKKLNIK